MKKAPLLAARIFFKLFFIFGLIFLLVWANGFRLDFKERKIVPVSVINVSSSENIVIYLDNKKLDEDHSSFVGIALGYHNIVFYPEGKEPHTERIYIKQNEVKYFHNLYFEPILKKTKIANKDNVIFDPLARGLVRFYPHLHSALIYDSDNSFFIDDLPGNEIFLNQAGELFSPFWRARQVFSDPEENSQPHNKKLITDQSRLFLADEKNIEHIREFDDPIQKAFFMPESDSFVVILPDKAYLFSNENSQAFLLFQKTSGSQVIFWPQDHIFFWEEDGVVWQGELLNK